MDDLTFISNVVSSMAWPTAAVAGVYVLRSSLAGVFNRLTGVDWNALHIDFQRDLAEAQALTIDDPLRSLPLTDQEVPVEERHYLLKLAELSPRALVTEAWAPVEAAAKHALASISPSRGKLPRASALIGQALADAGLLSESEFEIFTLLRNMRNRVSHEPDSVITADEALQYAVLADHLTRGIASRTHESVNAKGK